MLGANIAFCNVIAFCNGVEKVMANQYDRSMDLTGKQEEFVEAWLELDERPGMVAKRMGYSIRNCRQLLDIPKVKAEVARRKGLMLAFINENINKPVISKHEIAELYWEVAKAGAERGFDKEGNSIMLNPGSTNTALAGLGKLYGYDAPVEVVHTKVERTEVEIVANVQALQAELNALLTLDADSPKDGHDSVTIEGDTDIAVSPIDGA